MNLRKRIFAVLMSLTMVLTYMPAIAFAAAEEPASIEVPAAEEAAQNSEEEIITDADLQEPVQEEEDSEPIVVSVEPVTDTVKVGSKLGDSDDLLQQYVDDKVKEELASSDSSRQYSRSRKTNLTGANLKIYKALVSQIRKVASGESTDTSFHIRMSEVFDQMSYTAEELGVDEILVDTGRVNDEGKPIYDVEQKTLDKFDAHFEYDFEVIKNALIADYPYELYWYDKTIGVVYTTPGWHAIAENGEEKIYFNEDAELTFDFYVSADYSANATVTERGNLRTTSTNPDLTSAAAAAASNIAGILAANKDKSDVDKLTAYKDKICELVEYNDGAAADEQTPYGDPWQLIWVFDGIDTTKVVCEGYAKAFQYLCDNTLFDHAKIDCYSVSGFMDDDERHMWNILHMEDGKNYLADLTNCDEGSVGNPDKLFLKGYARGSMGDGYVFDCGGDQSVTYTYNETTLDQFSRLQLKLSDNDYGAGSAPQPQDNEGYSFIEDLTAVKGEWIHIPEFAPVTYKDKDGNEVVGRYEATCITIESQESETDEDVITALEFDDKDREWRMEASEFGAAVVKVDYKKLDGTDASYTFNVTVTDERYFVEIEPGEELEDIDTVFPGVNFQLFAAGFRKKSTSGLKDPYTTSKIEDSDAYRWELPDGCDKYATLEVAENGMSAVVRVKDEDTLRNLLGTDNIRLKLCVKVSLLAGNSVLETEKFYIDVEDVYSMASDALSVAENAAANVTENSSDADINKAQAAADNAVSIANDAVKAAKNLLSESQEQLNAAQSSGDTDAIAAAEQKVKAAKQTVADTNLTLAKAQAVSKNVAAKSASKAAAAAQAALDKTTSGTAENVAAAQAAVNAAKAASKAAEEAESAAQSVLDALKEAGYDESSDEYKNAQQELNNAATAKQNATKALSAASNKLNSAVTAKKNADAAAKAKAAAAAKAKAAAEKKARNGVLDKKIPKVKISKPGVKKNKITAKWKKLSKNKLKKSKATKYEIWICPNKAFAKADTKEKIVSKSKKSYKFSGLKKKTKYYVKVRAIRYAKGTKYVGPWSKVKSIKTKK